MGAPLSSWKEWLTIRLYIWAVWCFECLPWTDKVCGCSNAEDPVPLHQPSSLRMGGFSPLTSAESHLLDHGSHPHWPSDYCLHSIFPHDLNYSLVFPTSTFLMATYLPSIFNNDNDQKKKKALPIMKHYQNVRCACPLVPQFHSENFATWIGRDTNMPRMLHVWRKAMPGHNNV